MLAANCWSMLSRPTLLAGVVFAVAFVAVGFNASILWRSTRRWASD